VLLRKEGGVWKILMDADANEKTDETVFLSANRWNKNGWHNFSLGLGKIKNE